MNHTFIFKIYMSRNYKKSYEVYIHLKYVFTCKQSVICVLSICICVYLSSIYCAQTTNLWKSKISLKVSCGGSL